MYVLNEPSRFGIVIDLTKMLIVSLILALSGMMVFLNVIAIAGLFDHRFWGWGSALMANGMLLATPLFPLGILGVWGLLQKESRLKFLKPVLDANPDVEISSNLPKSVGKATNAMVVLTLLLFCSFFSSLSGIGNELGENIDTVFLLLAIFQFGAILTLFLATIICKSRLDGGDFWGWIGGVIIFSISLYLSPIGFILGLIGLIFLLRKDTRLFFIQKMPS